ncbi:hypothetical protein [Enterovirga rhinocerotis]|uniref:hypothetical protein n=1 Tax=Enterovirga rhinocerotis TaxID=1339210 RepID=UPI00105CFBB9|nr:hypothetical protein [Enterovirga rhinocerotis]
MIASLFFVVATSAHGKEIRDLDDKDKGHLAFLAQIACMSEPASNLIEKYKDKLDVLTLERMEAFNSIRERRMGMAENCQEYFVEGIIASKPFSKFKN